MSVLSVKLFIHQCVHIFRYTEYYNDSSSYIAATIVTRVSEAAACQAAAAVVPLPASATSDTGAWQPRNLWGGDGEEGAWGLERGLGAGGGRGMR